MYMSIVWVTLYIDMRWYAYAWTVTSIYLHLRMYPFLSCHIIACFVVYSWSVSDLNMNVQEFKNKMLSAPRRNRLCICAMWLQLVNSTIGWQNVDMDCFLPMTIIDPLEIHNISRTACNLWWSHLDSFHPVVDRSSGSIQSGILPQSLRT
jgi:hypothetical protein